MEHYKNLSLEDIEGEEWRDVVGYEGSYMVSSYGRIKSLNRYVNRGNSTQFFIGKIRHQCYNKQGYLTIQIGSYDNRKRTGVHRLVAQAFIPNPMNYPCVNHINEIKDDNIPSNLEWCTYSYNLNYGSRDGWQEVMGMEVEQYDLDGNFIEKYKSARYAERILGINSSNISSCCNGRVLKEAGFQWKYSNSDKIISKYINPTYIPVRKYDFDGVFIYEYDSVKKAAIDNGCDSANIIMCCKGKLTSAAGFLWKYTNDEKEIIPYTGLGIDVVCYDLLGNEIGRYRNMTIASKETGISPKSIRKSCRNEEYSIKGLIFKYIYNGRKE